MQGSPADFIPNQQSTDMQWQSWYEMLRSYFSKKTANELWQAAWSSRKSSSATTAKLDEYMKKNAGFEIGVGTWSALKEEADSAIFIGYGIEKINCIKINY